MMEFVQDWDMIQILGEGAYGEVKLLVHRVTNETVAVKIIDLEKQSDMVEAIKKETCIHKMLRHPNIIRYFGKREHANKQFIFMEYAAGGELFNKIEPDIGMPSAVAQKYMVQLLGAVDYMHKRGIMHRDLKPENILLDQEDNIKIIDFGLATVFRLNGRERILDKKCGTIPYIAPEVMNGHYHAIPADLWSCGIILVALLTGELPWDKPSKESVEYCHWLTDDYLTVTPWTKLGTCALSLARKILNPEPSSRPSVEEILAQPWMQLSWGNIKSDDHVGSPEPKKIRRQASLAEAEVNREVPTITLSQPLPRLTTTTVSTNLAKLLQVRDNFKYFSQPTQNEDLIINSSQMQFTQSPVTQDNFQLLVKRMTRFFVSTSCTTAVTELCASLDKFLYEWHIDLAGAIAISTVDNRKTQLLFKANAIDMDGKTLLDFRLCKGCGLEFKKRFLKIKGALKPIISQVADF